MKQTYKSPINAKLQAVIYDCDNPEALAVFYARLLGGEVESDPYGGYIVSAKGLGIELGFQKDEFYKEPVWLGSQHDQQPMVHIDISVEDQETAVAYAVSLGASVPEEQICQPDWGVQWITLLDPAGHPFCFFEE